MMAEMGRRRSNSGVEAMLPELAGDDLRLPHPGRHRRRRDLAPKKVGRCEDLKGGGCGAPFEQAGGDYGPRCCTGLLRLQSICRGAPAEGRRGMWGGREERRCCCEGGREERRRCRKRGGMTRRLGYGRVTGQRMDSIQIRWSWAC